MAIDVQELLDANPAPRKSDWMTAGEVPHRADSDTFWADPDAKVDNTTIDSPQQEFIEVVRPINTDGIRSTIATVEGNVVAFDRITAGLAALEQEHPHDIACDVTTPTGMKQALAGRSAWRNPRLELERARKAAKAPVLEVGRAIDKFAADVESRLRIGELNYDQQIKAEEHRRDVEKEQARQAEEQRVGAIRASIERISAIVQRAFVKPTTQDIRGKLALVDQLVIDERYAEFASDALKAKVAAIDDLTGLLARTEYTEAQAAQHEKDRQELEALRAERAERQRQDEAAVAALEAEAAAERARVDAEAAARRADADRAAQAEREAADREAAAKRDELDRLARADAIAAEERTNRRRRMVEAIDWYKRAPVRASAHGQFAQERVRLDALVATNEEWDSEPDLKQQAIDAKASAIEDITRREVEVEAELLALAKDNAVQAAGPALLAALLVAQRFINDLPITMVQGELWFRFKSVIEQADAAIKLTEVK